MRGAWTSVCGQCTLALLRQASTLTFTFTLSSGHVTLLHPPLPGGARGDEGKGGQSDDPRAVYGDVICAVSQLNHIVTTVNAKAGGEDIIPKVGGGIEEVEGEAAPLWTDSRMRAKSCRALMSNSICTRLC